MDSSDVSPVPASHRSDDLVRIGRPFEGLGLDVVLFEKPVDGVPEWLCTVERPARMRRKPFVDFRMLVGGIIVDDRVHDFSGGEPTSGLGAFVR
jgi:hypothetical protein